MTPRKDLSMDDLMRNMDEVTRALCEEADFVLVLCEDEDPTVEVEDSPCGR
jgi:hypothetical protein